MDDIHKRVGYRHSGNDHDVHKEGDGNDTLVEANKSVVLGKTIADEVGLNGLKEVPVECSIDEQVQELLDTVPVLVDDVVLVADLETGRNPDVEDTDVDSSDEHSCCDHNLP